MKKIFVSIVALAALAGCSKEEVGLPDNGNETGRVAIAPRAAIENNVVSRAAVEGDKFTAGTDVFRLCAFLSGDNAPTDWTVAAGTEAFEDLQVNCSDAGTLALSTPKFYPPTGTSAQKLWFYAYAPSTNGTYTKGNSADKPSVSYTITGQEDIMTGQVSGDNGIGGAVNGATQKQPAFNFTHLLKKVTFKVKAGDTFDESAGIKVEKIVVKKVNTQVTLNVVDGTFSDWKAEGDLSLTLEGDDQTVISKAGAAVPGCLMFEPGTTFTISITAGGVTYADATVTLTGTDAGKAGVSHEVTLTFHRSGITPTASITPWTPGDDAGVDIQ